jgi:ribosomal protein S18 acetylase RimI-like enzyme
MMRRVDLADRGHAGMADRYRIGALVDGGEALETSDGVLYAFRTDFPAMNGAIVAPGGDPARLVAAAREFFGRRGRGFTLYARSEADDHAARDAGMQVVKERMPAMVLRTPVAEPGASDGIELRRIGTDEEALGYLRVVEEAFATTRMRPGVLADFRPATVIGEETAGFVAYADGGEPVAAGSVVLARGIGGVQWVGVVEAARRRGLALLVTAAAANAGFAMGADCAWLEASTMGEPVYARMGFEEVFAYRVWLLAPPSAGA